MVSSSLNTISRKISLLKKTLASQESGFSEDIKMIISDIVASLKSCINLDDSLSTAAFLKIHTSIYELIKNFSEEETHRFNDHGGQRIMLILSTLQSSYMSDISSVLQDSTDIELSPMTETESYTSLHHDEPSLECIESLNDPSDILGSAEDAVMKTDSLKQRKSYKKKSAIMYFNEILDMLDFDQYPLSELKLFSEQTLPKFTDDFFVLHSGSGPHSLKGLISSIAHLDPRDFKKLKEKIRNISSSGSLGDIQQGFLAKIVEIIDTLLFIDNPIKIALEKKEETIRQNQHLQKIKHYEIQKSELEKHMYKNFPSMKRTIFEHIYAYNNLSIDDRLKNQSILQLFSSLSSTFHNFFTNIDRSMIELSGSLSNIKIGSSMTTVEKILEKEKNDALLGAITFAVSLNKGNSAKLIKSIATMLDAIEYTLSAKHEDIVSFLIGKKNKKPFEG